MRAFLALGGNLGDPPLQFAAALALMDQSGTRVVLRSSLYASPPLGPPQPDYVNAVAEVETDLVPAALLHEVLRVEQALGRRRDRRWGPRSLDVDILLYGAEVVAVPGLTIPHPGIPERAFVLVPLAEVAPTARHPVLGKTIEELLANLPRHQVAVVRRLDRSWP